MHIDGKTAIITGGSSGIGEGVARQMVALGARVVIADIDEELGAKLEAELNGGNEVEAGKRKAIFVKCDVRDGDKLRGLFDTAEREFGNVHIMCNNAGLGELKILVNDDSWKTCFDVNLKAVIEGTYIAIERMRTYGVPGLILNTASVAGIVPSSGAPVYSTTKGAVINFTRALTGLKDSHNIRVVAIAPWYCETPLVTKAMAVFPRIRFAVDHLEPVPLDDVVSAFFRVIDDDSLAGDVIEVFPGCDTSIRAWTDLHPGTDFARIFGGILSKKFHRWWNGLWPQREPYNTIDDNATPS